MNHGIKHLGGNNHRFPGRPASGDNPFLLDWDFLRGHLHTQIPPRDHYCVAQADNLLQAIQRHRLFQLRHHGGASSNQFARFSNILGTLNKRQSNPINLRLKCETHILPVFGRQRRKFKNRIGNVDAFVV